MTQANKLQASETAIANAINEASALKPEQADQAFNCGKRASNLQISFIENLDTFARMLGTNPTYAIFEQARIQWVSGYLSDRPNIEPSTADTAFSRFANALKENFGMEFKKPSSDNPVAKKKAEQRAAKKAELLAEYQDETIVELQDRLKANFNTLAVQPSNKDAKKTISELEKVIKAKQAEEMKLIGAELKELRAAAIDEIKACMNVDTLANVIEILMQSE